MPDTTMNSPPYVPYQAYKSKRHTRNQSSQPGSNGTSSSPQLRPQTPTSITTNGHSMYEPAIHQRSESLGGVEHQHRPRPSNGASIPRPASMVEALSNHEHPEPLHFDYVTYSPTANSFSAKASPTTPSEPPRTPPSPITIPPSLSKALVTNGGSSVTIPPVAGPSSMTTLSLTRQPGPTSRKTSTFRHVPLRANKTRPALPSSPLRPVDAHARTSSNASNISHQIDQSWPAPTSSQGPSEASSPVVHNERALPAIPTIELPLLPPPPCQDPEGHATSFQPSPSSAVAPPRSAPLGQFHSSSTISSPSPMITTSSVSSSPPPRTIPRSSALYRPGFQPKGVYRPRTDEFMEARNNHKDVGRVERTRLERRLEKLINLHFPLGGHELKEKEKVSQVDERRSRQSNKRLSSIFDIDFSELRSKSASDLWRDVLQSQVAPGVKNDIRAAEQTITPWEDDAKVSQCPLCSAAFHPLTNRKHHCRLCGRIICSLPIKYPQRPQSCSLLFVVDSKTGRIEEVSEGVDYGVRRRTTSSSHGKRGKEDAVGDDEKFLKGVRICRDCQPVLLREQYKQEVHNVPIFFKLYDAFIGIEKEIEDALPQFQELMLSLSKQERPTPEASAARKRLLEAFGQYDVLAKRIRQLPCPGGSGGSQDHIQAAVHTRANLFLQKHMFPLQSLPKSKNSPKSQASSQPNEQGIDLDSEVARVLQPLLEQEALLESFVEEAKAHRKFEDAKTLKISLQEIRAEINRVIVNAEAGMGSQDQTKARGQGS
ncbi:uncharacterized protein FIBRA_04144 [Fibroporia radiculosa]|uniref:FYVE-type domain-containing protein n=1 Tax=Fibroporia radiculosa TaxID=599839 RepID=J4G6W8_9APHY|nr:uncharacterized protein FIBRA_04144 [Fibroporia radiculosa]CCM02068.1 predicted protein [Fibroporia radiculosa]